MENCLAALSLQSEGADLAEEHYGVLPYTETDGSAPRLPG